MKPLVVLVVLLGVLGLSVTMTSAAVVERTGNLDANWNLIALPSVPLEPEPTTIFGAIPIDGRLFRWNAPTQSLIAYEAVWPETFGNMLLTDGYWINMDSGEPFSYDGLDDTDSMDVLISLPKAGWTMIGNPFSYNFPWVNNKVTDGNQTITIRDASQYGANWLYSVGYWWDSSTQSLVEVGLPEDYSNSQEMLPWHGYWVLSNIDKIGLILESIP